MKSIIPRKKPLYFKKAALLIFTVSILFLCLLSPAMAQAEEAEEQAVIENIKLANTRDDLLTYFDVKLAFTDKINEAILNGVPTTFSFYTSLYKTDGSWFDKKVSSVEFKSTVKYNSLKKEFIVSRPWKNDADIATGSFEEAKALMTEIDNLKIIGLDELVKGDKYQLRIKAELDKVTLPFYLHNVLFFLSFWDFETNWYVINFTY